MGGWEGGGNAHAANRHALIGGQPTKECMPRKGGGEGGASVCMRR